MELIFYQEYFMHCRSQWICVDLIIFVNRKSLLHFHFHSKIVHCKDSNIKHIRPSAIDHKLSVYVSVTSPLGNKP